ncbi:MAG: cytochrome c family protein [Bryobacter sp.]|jgi:hypothetical protein|nr:cytochrome c family protein [Bryobacter sp. CoA8 C33]
MKYLAVLLGCVLLWAGEGPKQPLAFSHKQHAGTLNLKCATCHVNPAPGEMMTFPAEAKCMGCHQVIKKDSEEIQKLARFFQEKKRVPWVRVYQVPTFVYWSHKSHSDAGLTCEKCHGEVVGLEVMAKVKDLSMGSCMDCHRQMKVSNDCTFCHDKVH